MGSMARFNRAITSIPSMSGSFRSTIAMAGRGVAFVPTEIASRPYACN